MSSKNGASTLAAHLTLCIAAFCLASTANAAPTYMVRDLGTLGGISSGSQAINETGQVSGYAFVGDTMHAVLFGNVGVANRDLGTIGGTFSVARGINNTGQVVGFSYATGNTDYRAVLFNASGGPNVDLGTLGGRSGDAMSINNLGQAVGSSYLTGNAEIHATLYSTSDGINVDLGTLGGIYSSAYDINDVGQVVGTIQLFSGETYAALFSTVGGPILNLGALGGTSSTAISINNVGQVVGWANTSGDAANHATIFSTTGGPNIDLGTLSGAIGSYAFSSNNRGQVVGISYSSVEEDAFIWQDGTMLALDAFIDPASEWDLKEAMGINDHGQIAAYGCSRNTKACNALLLTQIEGNTVPEPASVLLILLGLAGMVAIRGMTSRIETR